jgi:hypothetical protein
MNAINSISSVLSCLFLPSVYRLLPYGSEPTSRLFQQGVFLLVWCLCGVAIAVPALAFISFVIGRTVYVIRKRKVDSEKAKSQATLIALLSFASLVIAGCALVNYYFRDLYIP